MPIIINKYSINIYRANLGEAVINLLSDGNKEKLSGLEEVLQVLLEESDNETKFKLFKKIQDFGKFQ